MRGRRRRREPVHAMDVILAIMGVAIMLFTVAMIVLFCVYQQVPDTLIQYFFACCGSESGFMAVIMVAKKIREGRIDGAEDI